jgi:PilZ domain
MNVKVILVCQEGKAKQAYINALKPLGVKLDTVPSLSKLHKMLSKNFYNGVILDLKTKVRASGDEKGLTHEVIEQFPVAQLNFEEKTGKIRSFHYGQASKSETLEAFIIEECRSFAPRPIRSSPRENFHFNILLSKTGNVIEKEIDRTVTINISKGGCFIYSVDNLQNGEKVTMVFKELEDQRPILVEVRWKILWGEAMQIPGIGVKFEDISEDQFMEICKIIGWKTGDKSKFIS